MKTKLLLLSFAILFPFYGSCKEYTYTYDNAGNITKRTIYGYTLLTDDDGATSALVLKSELQIKIYPNPTHGIFNIEILNITEDSNVNIYLFDIMGGLVQIIKSNSTLVNIDISDKSSGMYILRVLSATGDASAKIIKK